MPGLNKYLCTPSRAKLFRFLFVSRGKVSSGFARKSPDDISAAVKGLPPMIPFNEGSCSPQRTTVGSLDFKFFLSVAEKFFSSGALISFAEERTFFSAYNSL